MLFVGRAANQTANILFHFDASSCFVSNKFCGLAGIVTEPLEGLTKLGNNHRVPVLGKARVHLRLGAFQRHISCLVFDLMDGVDVILGDDFMTNHDVELNFRNRCDIIRNGRRRIMVNKAPLVQESLQVEPTSNHRKKPACRAYAGLEPA
jgi:hypothetical protein